MMVSLFSTITQFLEGIYNLNQQKANVLSLSLIPSIGLSMRMYLLFSILYILYIKQDILTVVLVF